MRTDDGRALVRSLYAALGCAREADAMALAGAIRELTATVRTLGRRATLVASGRGLYLDGVRTGLDSTSFVAVEAIRALLEDRQVAGLTIESDVATADLEAGIRAIAAPHGVDGAALLRERGACGFELVPLEDAPSRLAGERSAAGSDLRSVYVAKLLLDQVGDARIGNARLAKSIVKCVADAVLGDHRLIALLAVLERHDARSVRHGAMVAVCAILIGRRIGVPAAPLVELGVAALFHDVVGSGASGVAGPDATDGGAAAALLGLGESPLALRVLTMALRHGARGERAAADFGSAGSDLLGAIVWTADVYCAAAHGGGPEEGRAAVRRAVAQREVPPELSRCLDEALLAVAE